jgi:hypothetical protein
VIKLACSVFKLINEIILIGFIETNHHQNAAGLNTLTFYYQQKPMPFDCITSKVAGSSLNEDFSM